MAKKQKLNGHAPPAADHSHIAFAEAVAEGKEIIKQMDGEQRRHQLRLGQLADEVAPIYGDRTRAKLAKEIAISACTLNRYLSVYRAWKGKEAPGPVSYAVLRALQDHPDREAIVNKQQEITKSQAQEIMRAYKGKKQNKKADNWKADERKRWLRGLRDVANKYGRAAEEVMQDDDLLSALREAAEPDVVAALAADLKVLGRLTEELVAPQDEETEKPERRKPDLNEAEGVAA